jgi:hypothetical protein
MGCRLADGDGPLSVSCEFWPVPGHGSIELDQAAVDHLVEQSGHHAFAGRHAQRKRLRLEGSTSAISRAAGEIGDQLTSVVDGNRGSARSVFGSAPSHHVA